MVRRDMLARYRGSFAGALWTFLNPLLQVLSLWQHEFLNLLAARMV